MHAIHATGRIRRTRLLHCYLSGIVWMAVGCSDQSVLGTGPAPVPPPSFAIADALELLGLEMLPAPVPTYFSPGSRERAEDLQARLRPAVDYFRDRMKVNPPVTLAVLSEEHWAAISPSPYGVPFNREQESMVVVPAVPEKAAVTKLYNAARVALPPGAAADLARIGITYDDAVLLGLDLIGLFHETGHVYNAALGYRDGETARFLREFLATYTAYAYLDAAQPTSIIVWNALSEAVIEFVQPTSRSIDVFNALGLQELGPAGYGWFQSHFNLRNDLVVRQRPHATWFHQLAAAGLDHGSFAVPTSDLLRRLRGFNPSFAAWAEGAGMHYE